MGFFSNLYLVTFKVNGAEYSVNITMGKLVDWDDVYEDLQKKFSTKPIQIIEVKKLD